MKAKKQPAATNISSDDLTCNSYNTTEEEDDDEAKKDRYPHTPLTTQVYTKSNCERRKWTNFL